MKVRKVSKDELLERKEGLAKLYREVYSGDPWYEKWTLEEALGEIEKNLINKDSICILAFENGEIIGFCWGYPAKECEYIPFEVSDEDFYFAELGVKRNYRKRGIGTELVRKLFEEVKKTYKRVIFFTHLEFRAVDKIIEKLGYKAKLLGIFENPYKEGMKVRWLEVEI